MPNADGNELGKQRRLAEAQKAESREPRAFWAASLEKLADSAALNGDTLDRRKIGLAWLFWISLFQYCIR